MDSHVYISFDGKSRKFLLGPNGLVKVSKGGSVSAVFGIDPDSLFLNKAPIAYDEVTGLSDRSLADLGLHALSPAEPLVASSELPQAAGGLAHRFRLESNLNQCQ
jgi:hypothetical protein